MNTKKIIKKNGKIADFNREKLITSLTKSGASKSVVQKITDETETALYDGIASL